MAPGGTASGGSGLGGSSAPGSSVPGGSTVTKVSELSAEDRRALAALLELSQHLMGLATDDSERHQRLAGYADSVATEACRLAGLGLPSDPPRQNERILVSLEVERHTDKLWSTHVSAPDAHCEASYYDGPSRSISIALGLVLLARTVLDCVALHGTAQTDPTDRQQASTLQVWLAELMEAFDDTLGPADTPELNCHGLAHEDD